MSFVRRLISAIAAATVVLSSAPAQAHESVHTSEALYSPAPDESLCVAGQALLNHGDWTQPPGQYLYTGAHYKDYSSGWGNCPNVPGGYYPRRTIEAGRLKHKWDIYRNGSLCFVGPWHVNSTPSSGLVFQTNSSIWHTCNYGYNVHVNVTVDSQHIADIVWANGQSYSRAHLIHNRPTSGHCFCP